MPAVRVALDETLIHSAARWGILPLLAHDYPGILTPRAFTELRDLRGCTPLHRAAAAGNLGQVLSVCPSLRPAAFDTRDNLGGTPLHHAAEAGTLDKVLSVCPGLGPDAFEARDDIGGTLLHWAAAGGRLAEFRIPREVAAADFLVPDGDGWTPLHAAAEKGQLDLVCAGAVTVENLLFHAEDRTTPLEEAITWNHLDQVAQLCPAVLTPEILLGGWFLHAAAASGELVRLRDLVPRVITAETLMRPDPGGETPLYLSAENEYLDQIPEVCPAVLTPANLLAPNREGRTALHAAVIAGTLGPVPPIDPATLPEDLRGHPVLEEKWKAHLARKGMGGSAPGGAEVGVTLA